MKKSPQVSVVIPVYNGEKTLRQCLDSVLNQTYKDYEVVVVDNNSTDETKEIIKEFQNKNKKVKYVFESRRGMGAPRYKGEKTAKGKIIAMTDCDCIVPKNWIEAMIEPLVKGKAIAVQGLKKPIIKNYWTMQWQEERERFIKARLRDKKIGLLDPSNFIIKKSILEDIGYSNRRLLDGNDVELMVRLKIKNYDIHFKNIAVLHYHPSTASEIFNKFFKWGEWYGRIRRMYKNEEKFFQFWGIADFINYITGLTYSLLTFNKNFKYYLITGIAWRLGLLREKLKDKVIRNQPPEYVTRMHSLLGRAHKTIVYKLEYLKKRMKFLYNYYFFLFTNKVPFPDFVVIDPINICNLKCPLCPPGINKLNYKKTIMTIDTFKVILNKLTFLRKIALFNWGEPFLNPDIFKIILYAKEKGIFVSIDSNFNLKKNEDFFINIVKSGLDLLTVSLDGASQSTYSKYRRGGDFNLVISNIKTLIKIKKRFNAHKPRIIWKFIVNNFNEHEIKKSKKMASKLRVEFVTDTIGLSDDVPDLTLEESLEQRKSYWLPQNKKYVSCRYKSKKPYNRICYFLFNTTIINPDGRIFPCCHLTNENNVFGDLLKESFEDIWKNEKYTYSRSLFTNRKYQDKKIKTICFKCKFFEGRNKKDVIRRVN